MSTIIRHGRYALLALLGWLAILIAMPFLGPAGREVAVVGDADRRACASSPPRAGGWSRSARARSLAYARPAALYRAGAWLVIEGRIAAGCFQPVAPRSGA